MKRIFLSLFILLTYNSVFSQKFEYYLNNLNIEDNTFSKIEPDALLKVKFMNPTNYKFRISSLTVIITYDKNTEKSTNQGASPDDLETVRKTINNNSNLYSLSPNFSFDLHNLLSEFKKWKSVSFLIDKLSSTTEEGTAWANHLRFTETNLVMSIKTDAHMQPKGGNK